MHIVNFSTSAWSTRERLLTCAQTLSLTLEQGYEYPQLLGTKKCNIKASFHIRIYLSWRISHFNKNQGDLHEEVPKFKVFAIILYIVNLNWFSDTSKFYVL